MTTIRRLLYAAIIALTVAPDATAQLRGLANGGDRFGESTAVGDFNGDGIDDLALGAPRDEISGVRVGSVNVAYGSDTGLLIPGNQLWTLSGIFNIEAKENDLFGAALAAGDFDDDGFGDLAIGVPCRELRFNPFVTVSPIITDAGIVIVLYGTADGLSTERARSFNKQTFLPGVGDVVVNYDRTGSSLAAGDVDGDGVDDLAIVAANDYEDGELSVLWGSTDGLSLSDHNWIRLFPGVADIAMGDFSGIGRNQVAVGLPKRKNASGIPVGGFLVYTTTGGGFRASLTNASYWLTSLGLGANSGVLGRSLCAGDFNGDGLDDLALYATAFAGSEIGEGAVLVINGDSTSILDRNNAVLVTLSTSGVRGDPKPLARFGAILSSARLGSDRFDDLIVGSPWALIEGQDAGTVHFLRGSADGLTASFEDYLDPTLPSVGGQFGNFYFGHELIDGDFNNDGRQDLVVGVRLLPPGMAMVFDGIDEGIEPSPAIWSQNFPPGKPSFTNLGPISTVAVGGSQIPTDPATDFVVDWNDVEDENGTPVTYRWRAWLADSLETTVIDAEVGEQSHYSTNTGSLAALLNDRGAALSDSLILFHHVLATDWSDTSFSETYQLTLVRGMIVSTEQPNRAAFRLDPVFPNPSTGTATIAFMLSQPAFVTVLIFDVLGRRRDVLLGDYLHGGSHNLKIDVANLAAGPYFVRLETDRQVLSRSFTVAH